MSDAVTAAPRPRPACLSADPTTVPVMPIRPSDHWRDSVEQEKHDIAAGTLEPEEAVMTKLFPESLLIRTDQVLAAFEADLATLSAPSDDQVIAAVEHTVLALNEVNREHDCAGYETDEREQLCDYIDKTMTEAGIDVVALTSRRGISRYEITDEWRRW
jgi:hypothetical protein